jgi:hypothetical protein
LKSCCKAQLHFATATVIRYWHLTIIARAGYLIRKLRAIRSV